MSTDNREDPKKPVSIAIDSQVRSALVSLSQSLERTRSWTGNQVLRMGLNLPFSPQVRVKLQDKEKDHAKREPKRD